MSFPNCQALITRLPYSARFNAKPILEMVQFIDVRGLIGISMPIHVESPNNGGRLICELEDAGLILCAKIAWVRDRHIVTTKSRRITNCWEPVAIFARQKNYHINREAVMKIKKGYEGREATFEEEFFLTCMGDLWPIRNDRRDRRYLPAGLVLNCGQLADLMPGSRVLDPYGNPGVKDACRPLGWQYVDGGLPNKARNEKEHLRMTNEKENISGDGEDEEEILESDQGSVADSGRDTGTGWKAHSS